MFKITTAPNDALISQLIPIVTQACEILRAEYQAYCAGETFAVQKKIDHSPVTQADYRVNAFITQALQNSFPHISVLSEEGDHTARQHWQHFWLLDPLDGTKEFLHQRAEFTINLSLVEGAETTFAILAVPAEQIIYICPQHGLPLKFEIQTQRWQVYTQAEWSSKVHIGLSQSTQAQPLYVEYLDLLKREVEVVALKAGSAYKFCMMLEDKVDIYPRFHPTCEWDTSAGQCFIERIGGGLVDFKGRPFLYNQRDSLLNGGFIAFRNVELKKLAFVVLAQMSHLPEI